MVRGVRVISLMRRCHHPPLVLSSQNLRSSWYAILSSSIHRGTPAVATQSSPRLPKFRVTGRDLELLLVLDHHRKNTLAAAGACESTGASDIRRRLRHRFRTGGHAQPQVGVLNRLGQPFAQAAGHDHPWIPGLIPARVHMGAITETVKRKRERGGMVDGRPPPSVTPVHTLVKDRAEHGNLTDNLLPWLAAEHITVTRAANAKGNTLLICHFHNAGHPIKNHRCV